MNKKLKIILGAAVLLTAAVAIIHLTTRTAVPKGQLRVIFNEKEIMISLSDLQLKPVQGTISNAKGDQRTIDALGLPLMEVLSAAGADNISKVTLVADDEYRAELTAEEAAADGNAYLILQEDGGVQLIVFSDNNSKRNVSNTVQIEVS